MIFGEAIYTAVSLYGSPSPEISCSWVRWCMHKTIKIIVEATWGLAGWLAGWLLSTLRVIRDSCWKRRRKQRPREGDGKQELSNYIENNSLKCSWRSVLGHPRPCTADAFPRGFPIPFSRLRYARDDAYTFDFKKILPAEYTA